MSLMNYIHCKSKNMAPIFVHIFAKYWLIF